MDPRLAWIVTCRFLAITLAAVGCAPVGMPNGGEPSAVGRGGATVPDGRVLSQGSVGARPGSGGSTVSQPRGDGGTQSVGGAFSPDDAGVATMPRDMGAATNALGPEVSPSTDGGGSLLPDLRIQSGFSVKLRVGGRQDGKAWSPFATYSGPLRIGAAANGAKGFNGLIDRVRVYNMAISDEDMIAHGNGIYEPCAASVECVADWTFDQERDGAFASTGRRPFPAKIVGEIKTADSRDGKAIDIKMNGLVATGWIEVAFDPAFDLREAFSLEAWILFTNDCGSKCAFYNVYDRAPAFDLEIHGGSWVARRGGGVSVPPLASFPGGRKWSHIGLTYTKHELRVFKDGKLSKTINP